jgi:hypothetical protein
MTSAGGFEYFDGNQRENFAAALILLCLSEDAEFTGAFVRLVRNAAGLTPDARLEDWGREARLDPLDPANERERRSDLWLRFADGIVLVEVKTHSGWDPDAVRAQLEAQRCSVCRGTPVKSAILLAPSGLLSRINGRKAPEKGKVPSLSWHDIIQAAAEIKPSSRLLELAREHWSRTVERDFALVGPSAPLDQLAAQTACYVAFLRRAFLRLGGEPKGDSVWFSSPDGRPSSKDGWAWIGIAVPGSLPRVGRAYIGIYTYTAAPTNDGIGVFVEVYAVGRDDEIVSLPLSQSELSTEHLHKCLDDLAGKYSAADKGEVKT